MFKVRTVNPHTSVGNRFIGSRAAGFTLIEIIVGIVVLGVALTLITSLIVPAARQSVSPVYQVRAAELGQTMLNEIISKSFDQQSDRQGGRLRCDPISAQDCTAWNALGPDTGEQRENFNDVDDFDGLNQIQSALGEDLSARYPGYELAISVCYATPEGQCVDAQQAYKRILVVVTTPEGQRFDFSAIRGNF
ncbi:MAG: type II secretion system protein [Idiomarina sp.]|nr:type II secretion system protein [Idiomarina sp.]